MIFVTQPGYIYGPAILLSKVYANSMMVFLNDRAPALRGRDDHVASDVVTVSVPFILKYQLGRRTPLLKNSYLRKAAMMLGAVRRGERRTKLVLETGIYRQMSLLGA